VTEPLIVVPLDGSELSESALPYAIAFAKALKTRLLLLTVWEEGDRALLATLPGRDEGAFAAGERHWEAYLAAHAKAAQAAGVDASTDVRIGEAGDEVLRIVDQHEPRLLVLATHGRSGLNRWRYGSVAGRLAREAPVPTLLVGPKVLEAGVTAPGIRRILVPLDGSPLSEAALAPAVELAEALGAVLVLAQVLRWASQAFIYGVPDADVAQIDRELTKAAEEYLVRTKDSLATKQTVETMVLHGPPADALTSVIEAESIDLVVMTSHARGVLQRALLGSVADRLLQGAAPVLLVRPEEITAIARSTTGRYCHACGRASPYVELLPDDRCRRCGQHLHTCPNCVYYDGVACLLQRPELRDTPPGHDCAYFQFRESAEPTKRDA
jgi:nucleotide-binding universal stress UspA family protein